VAGLETGAQLAHADNIATQARVKARCICSAAKEGVAGESGVMGGYAGGGGMLWSIVFRHCCDPVTPL
jgi:hypothetical protein